MTIIKVKSYSKQSKNWIEVSSTNCEVQMTGLRKVLLKNKDVIQRGKVYTVYQNNIKHEFVVEATDAQNVNDLFKSIEFTKDKKSMNVKHKVFGMKMKTLMHEVIKNNGLWN